MNQKFLTLTWDDIDRQCSILSNKIIDSKFNPDIIISIGRGGMVPSRILSDLLNVKNVYMHSISSYVGINSIGTVNAESLKINIYNQSVLLVDDIVDSGGTMEFMMREIVKSRPKSVKFATLLCKDHVVIKPSYYAEECSKDSWVIYPWEKKETLRGSH